jgi:hypothetical protein
LVICSAGPVAGGAALLVLIFHLWIVAGVLGGVCVAATFSGTVLLRRADPEQLEERRRTNERALVAFGRAMGRMSGGWEPRGRDRGGR